MNKFLALLSALVLLGATSSSVEAIPVLTNGSFESGDFTGWSFFTTTHGLIDPVFPSPSADPFPRVEAYDTNGNGTPSNSALFMVGVDPGNPLIFEGGGISQSFDVLPGDAGELTFGLDIAVSGMANSSGGWFQLYLDDIAIAEHNFGSILFGTSIERASLTATRSLAEGMHSLRIEMRRNFQNIGGQTPIQYLDNIIISSTGMTDPDPFPGTGGGFVGNPVPEPSTFGLMATGVAGIGLWARKKRGTQRKISSL